MTTQEQNDAAVSSKKNKLMAYFSSYITPTKHLSEKSLRSAKTIAKHLLVRRKWATRLHLSSRPPATQLTVDEQIAIAVPLN